MKRRLELDTRVVALPKGTRVVLLGDVVARDGWTCRSGSVARIEEVDHPSYVVRTPADHVVDVARSQLTVQNARLADVAGQRAWSWEQFADDVVLEVVVGSTAWNLAGPDSDEDVRGAFLLPHDHAVGLYDAPDELQPAGAEAQYWEVEKVIRQGLRADANTLEMLWTPLVRVETGVGRLLREQRDIFVSKRIYSTFGRYAISQFEKMQRKLEQHEIEEIIIDALVESPNLPPHALVDRLVQRGIGDAKASEERLRRVAHAWFDRGVIPSRRVEDLRDRVKDGVPHREPFRPKNAYNLVRLLKSGISWVREGEPIIAVTDPVLRARLMSIKAGEVPLGEVAAEARALAAEFDDAIADSRLPEEPDVDAADALLRTCRGVATRRFFGLSDLLPPRIEPVVRRTTAVEVDLGDARTWIAGKAAGRDVVLVALTGAHDYGFPSPDSDLDLKGIYLAAADELMGMGKPLGGVDVIEVVDGVELDLTLNEAGDVLRLLAKGNGNMLERLASPFQVLPGDDARAIERVEWLRYEGLRSVHKGSLHHYRGFFGQCARRAVAKPSVKGWLYAYRVAMTGVHLLSTGAVVADLTQLMDDYGLSHLRTLVELKMRGEEKGGVEDVPDALKQRVLSDLDALELRLQDAHASSPLPDMCPNRGELEAWLRYWRVHPIG